MGLSETLYSPPQTGKGAKLTLSHDGKETTVDLYSEQGLDLVAALWTKLTAEYKLNYEPSWLGVPIIQFPEDIVMLQELLWKLRPDVVVETGVAHGGALLLYASLCELIGHGQVIGVDVEIRKYNRVAIEAHALSPRIRLIEGSSTAPETVAAVRQACAGARQVVVLLDSNHSRDHVRQELELYHDLVPAGGYLVAMDGAQGLVHDTPRGKPEWRDDNPLPAIEDFLAAHDDFVVDPHYTRLRVTFSPMGFLRRLTPEERASQSGGDD